MLKTLDWKESFDLQSIIKQPTWHDLLDMDPLMLIGYTVVGGAGLFAIWMAKLENRLAKKDDDDRAILVGIIAKSVLMAAGIAGAIYYVIVKNPLWKFF
jgi:hypothetical protein